MTGAEVKLLFVWHVLPLSYERIVYVNNADILIVG